MKKIYKGFYKKNNRPSEKKTGLGRVILLDSLNHRTFVNLLWDSPREWTSCQEKGFFFILCLRPAKVHAPSLCFKGHLGAIIMVVCCTTFTIDWNSFWSRIFHFHATSFCQVDNNLIFISPNSIPMFLLVYSLLYNCTEKIKEYFIQPELFKGEAFHNDQICLCTHQ